MATRTGMMQANGKIRFGTEGFSVFTTGNRAPYNLDSAVMAKLADVPFLEFPVQVEYDPGHMVTNFWNGPLPSAAWVAGTAYVVGDIVSRVSGGTSTFYVANTAHTSSNANQPGVGVQWDEIDVWATGQTITALDYRAYMDQVYQAVFAHTSATENRP